MTRRRLIPTGAGIAASIVLGISGVAGASTLSVPTGTGIVRADAVVARAVAHGLTITKLPSSVSLNLSHAHANTYRSYSTRCSMISGRCVIGSSRTKKSIVVVGDSHAQQWLPPLIDRFAAHYRITAIFNAQCPPADVDVQVTPGTSADADCASWRDATVKSIASLKPTLILVAESTYRRLSPDGSPVSVSTWSTGLLSTLTQLKTTGAKVAVIGDNPTFQTSPTSCLQQHIANVQACTKNPAKIPVEFRNLAEAEKNAAASAGVGYIDTTRWFCKVGRNATLCPAIIGNVLPYSDASHVSLNYSHFLATALKSAVLRQAK